MIMIALIIVLRVSVGWHFLYEGLWKMKPANGFTAKGFLGMAKGPTRGLYYMMLPDLDGSERLTLAKAYHYDEATKVKKEIGLTLPVFENEWFAYYKNFKKKYQLTDAQLKKTDAILNQYVESLRDYAQEKQEDIQAFIGSKKRQYKKMVVPTNGAEHQKIRDWDMQMKLRKEGAALADEVEKMGANMELAFWNELKAVQKAVGKMPPLAYGQNKIPGASLITNTPFINEFAKPTRLGFLDLSVTLGLSAIGFCLMIGFCTRLAALGGAIFMFNVCLSQFPWPTVYPYSPEVVGHFMIFGKDSAELLILLLLAAIPSGRWGGLDWFIWNFGGKQIMSLWGWKKDPLCPESLDLTEGKKAA